MQPPKPPTAELAGSPKVGRADANHRWDDEWDKRWQDEPVTRLGPGEAQALMQLEPPVSPWLVVLVQLVVGVAVALVAWAVTGRLEVFWSALYGAAVVVVPAVLMARGITSPLSQSSPGAGVVSFMAWMGVKVAVSVGMLMAAYRIVPALSWPALLVGLVVCIKVYWVALLWRRSGSTR